MHREDVIKIVEGRLKALGVPKHVSSVRKVPGYVELQVLTGDQMRRIELRSGITPTELDLKLTVLENQWHNAKEVDGHQVTLEEAIEASRSKPDEKSGRARSRKKSRS